MPDVAFLDLFQRLAMALAIGFIVGVERGWTHRDAAEGSRAAGLRTHALIGLFGGISAALTPAIGAAGFAALTIAFAATFLCFKVLESQRDDDISVTGAIAGLLVFALGAYAVLGDTGIAAASGVALVGLLAFKSALHAWLDKLTWVELRSALLILAATAIALPLLPDRALDPWGAIRPRELWLLTILVAGASFAGYVAVRILGAEIGILAGAAAGALVSSTLVTAELGRRARQGDTVPAMAAAAAALAAAISIARAGLLASATAAAMLPQIALPLGAAVLIFSASAYVLRRIAGAGAVRVRETRLQSPLTFTSVAKFALLLGAVIVIGRIIADRFGQAGLLPFAATAGLADVDAAVLAASSLVRGGLDAGTGARAVLAAVLVNTFAKAGIAFAAGGKRYGAFYLAAAFAALFAGAAALIFNAALFA